MCWRQNEVHEMPDTNPKLTASLNSTRDILIGERSDILRRIAELHSALDMNSAQIEAADTLILRFNPEHVALDVRTDGDAAPMLVVKRPLLESSTAIEVIPSTSAAAPSSKKPAKAKATGAAKGKTATAKAKKAKSKSEANADAATTEAPASTGLSAADKMAQRSPARQAISEYFHKSRRNDTILQILAAKDEPVNAAAVASDYKALYPLPQDSSNELKGLHSGRIAAALHYLKDRGQVVRIADERGEGKHGENVRWELSKSYRSELRKGRRAMKTNGHAGPLSIPAVDANQVAATTH